MRRSYFLNLLWVTLGLMADGFEEQGWVKMGVASALAQQFESDQRPLLQLLADSFERAFPNQTTQRTKGFFGAKHVVWLEVVLGDFAFTIEDSGRGSLMATKKKIVRGIALKTEQISMPDCLAELGQALEARARTSAETYNALAESLGLQP